MMKSVEHEYLGWAYDAEIGTHELDLGDHQMYGTGEKD